MSSLHTALSGALSDFGQQLATERERLLSGLVQSLAGAQAGGARHVTLLESSLAALQHQRFADANPRDVDELLGDRFGEHAQFGKQRALQLLREQLAGLKIDSTQYEEFKHRLLAFLYAASRSPLSAPYSGSSGGAECGSAGLVDVLEQRARTAVVGSPTYLSDAGSDSWREGERGAYSPTSQLSDWEGEEDAAEGEDTNVAAAGEAAADVGAEAAAAPPARQPPHAYHTQHQQQQQQHLQQASPLQRQRQPRRESPYSRTSLSVWLASKASGGQPASLLDPRLCFHERELVQQVIHMLKGVSSPGPAFQLDPVRGVYLPFPGVHLHSSSHGSARALLLRFAATATAVRWVQAFCSAAVRAGSGTSGSTAGDGVDEMEDAGQEQEERRLHSLPTVTAFAAAVAEQQQGLQQQLLVIEAAFSSGALLSLLQLQQRAACLAEQAGVLAALARRCCCWRGSPAETSAALLTGLHEALQLQLLQARSQGGVLAAMLLRVFTAACRPLLGALHKWLYRGVLDDPASEFFIQASDAGIPTDSPRFWSEGYTLRTVAGTGTAASSSTSSGSSSGVPAAPCFLLPLAESILAAGKAALLLQAYSSWRLAAAAAAAGRSSAAAATANGRGSPSKRRLSEYGALGFAIAAGGQQEQQQQHPYGVPPPAGPLPDSLALVDEQAPAGGGGEGPGPEPLLLHQQLLRNLEAQLQEQLLLATQEAAPLQQQQLELEQQQSSAAVEDGGASPASGSSGSSSYSSGSGGSHVYRDEWAQTSAACGGHALLLLPARDALPPLAAMPSTPEGLPAAAAATIAPAVPPAAAVWADDRGCQPVNSSSRTRSANGSMPSIAERMRQAAAARVQQAVGTAAANQLPLLIISPAPLEALAAAAGRAEEGGAEVAAATKSAAAAAAVAAQFDSSSWRQWYQQVSASLSQQLQVLDSIGVSGSSSSGRRRQVGSYGVPLGLPRYTGSPSEQLWGRGEAGVSALTSGSGDGGLSSLAVAGQQRQQLRPELAAGAAPLDVLLQHSLLRPVRAQVEASGGALCSALLRHGLLRQLAALRDTYLLGSPLLKPFVAFLLHRISSTRGGIDGLSEFELNAALQDALVAGGKARLLLISAHMLPPAASSASRGGGNGSGRPPLPPALSRVQQLARLCLRVEPGWPLSLLVGEDMLRQYNAVLVLLLQLRWVKQSLQSVRYHGWKAGRRRQQQQAAGQQRDALQHQMVHLVDSVLQYITDRVVAAGSWLEAAMQDCSTLDAMHACRAKYLRAVTRYCLLSSEGVARLVHEALLHLLNACLQYCTLHRQAAATAAALQAAETAAAGVGAAAAVAAAAAAGGRAEEDGEAGADGVAAAAAAGLPRAPRKADLQRRAAELAGQLAGLRREFGNRQRLLLRVLATKAAEAGSHADELRQLLGALDFNRYFEFGMA